MALQLKQSGEALELASRARHLRTSTRIEALLTEAGYLMTQHQVASFSSAFSYRP